MHYARLRLICGAYIVTPWIHIISLADRKLAIGQTFRHGTIPLIFWEALRYQILPFAEPQSLTTLTRVQVSPRHTSSDFENV
jgi:hypothetical protein